MAAFRFLSSKCICLKLRTYCLMFVTLMLVCAQVYAERVNIATIETANVSEPDASRQALFKEEIIALFKGEYDVNFISYPIQRNASLGDIDALVDTAYANPRTDVVLVLDIAANQAIGLRSEFDKPTFLPTVISSQLLGYPFKDEASGQKNLSYITWEFDFEEELAILHTIARFERAVLIVDQRLERSLKAEQFDIAKHQAKNVGVNLSFLIYDGNLEKTLSSIPVDTEAVLYGSFPTASGREIKALINGVNEKNLLSFSLAGEGHVRLGALATNNPRRDWERLARRTAIYIERVLLGEAAKDLPVIFGSSNQLMINMATSRQIRYAPSFDVLADAVLINQEDLSSNISYSLTEVARTAVDANLSLAVQQLQTDIIGQSVKEAKGALLPQINTSLAHTEIGESDATRSGATAERSTDGSISLRQAICSEDLRAAFAVQRYAHLSEKEQLRQIELDIIQSAVTTYLNVLLEQTSLIQERYNLDITRSNYELSKSRVNVGSANASDLFRWESELANAKQAVLFATADVEQQRQALNQILNRPIAESFITEMETLENPSLIISDERITNLIQNVYDLQALTDFFVEVGLERAPELQQLKAEIAGNERQLTADKRAYWAPDVDLTAEYNNNFSEDRVPGGFGFNNDGWTAGLQFSLPVFEGGARDARTAQSRLAVRQLEAQYQDTKNTIEQTIRSTMEDAHATYNAIELAKVSEVASQKNYELVAASYAQGLQSIVNVLDAQEALIEAREASMNASYSFLINLMNLQRAIGGFDFFLTDTQRLEFTEDLIKRVQ